jgi:hypothetical protein
MAHSHRLLVVIGVMVMMIVMVVGMYNDHDLRLRRNGYCEAEDESDSEQQLFHVLMMRHGLVNSRATLTSARKRCFLCHCA